MQGYLRDDERTARAIVELDGVRWYKTGDKGHLDADGFLTIVDRYSRFAKIGGEMVSLSVVEEKLRAVLAQPELELVAVALPDDKKGEKIIALIATNIGADDIRKQLLAAQLNPMMIPAAIGLIAEVPKLGSGKTDFAAAKKLALEVVSPPL
jgi:acyl-[acyl-carrier-protein]-phospholipid O-acyltransferase/long-chain-fatty-acid--[acyl-carrier-protein] ligase